MASVLVTGGTGLLGKRLVPRLVKRGHRVRVLARHVVDMQEAEVVAGDVRTGAGLQQATAGIDAVIHAATNPRRTARQTEVAGTANVLRAIEGSAVHLVYMSIVGVDRHRFPYYKAKWEAEQLVAASSARWTIQRATQFHDLLDMFLGYPLFIATPHLAFQVVDTRDVAERLADIIDAGPSERADDFGGPEVLGIRELAAARRRITQKRARLLRVPRVAFVRDFDDGNHLCPDNPAGRITWDEWLSRKTLPTSSP